AGSRMQSPPLAAPSNSPKRGQMARQRGCENRFSTTSLLFHRDDDEIDGLAAQVLRFMRGATGDQDGVTPRPGRLCRFAIDCQRHLTRPEGNHDLVVVMLGSGRLGKLGVGS